MSEIPSDWLWIVIVGFVISFILACGIGANDVANSFGTSVGANVLTLVQACILGSIFEIIGAVLIGYKVSDTMRKGIIDVHPYNGTEELLLLGNLSALAGSCIWLVIATFLSLPVSATHSIVGATVGFSLVAKGLKGISWSKLGLIVVSWFVSPVTSGSMTSLLFLFLRRFILNKSDQLSNGLFWLPFFYSVTIAINTFSIFHDGSALMHFDRIPLYGTFIISIGCALTVAAVVRLIVVPWQRKKIGGYTDDYTYALEEKGVLVASNDQIFQESEGNDSAHREATKTHPDRLEPVATACNCSGSLKRPDELSLNNAELPLYSTNCFTAVENVDVTEGNYQSATLVSSNGISHHFSFKHGSDTINGDLSSDIADKQLHLPNGDSVLSSDVSYSEPVDSAKKTFGPSESNRVQEPPTDRGNGHSDLEMSRKKIKDTPETKQLFSFLQILTAIFGSFAHGGNDVSNAIGPLVALWIISHEGSVMQKAATPIWVLMFGGVGIAVGLCLFGHRVVKTMGEDLSKITPSSGFCIEVGSALTVLVASKIGLPISTTHCKVGSIVMVGYVRSDSNVDWSLFRNIFISWVITLPASAGFSAAIMAIFKYCYLQIS